MTTKYASGVLIAAAALMLCACGSKPPTISVGSKNTTEGSILGEIVAAHLGKQLPGVQIDRKTGQGGTQVLQGAMQSGAVDVYVEDVGTMLSTILKEDVPPEANVGLERARAQYQRLYQVTVLSTLGFHHKFVVLSRATGAPAVKADTLSAVAEAGKALKLGAAYDLFDRKDAFTALTTKYRITMSELPLRMEAPAMYEALKAGTIDLAAGYSTDAWTNLEGFKVLKDDKDLFQAYPACLLVRNPALALVPGLQHALEALAGTIKDDAMRKMNQDVDIKHRDPVGIIDLGQEAGVKRQILQAERDRAIERPGQSLQPLGAIRGISKSTGDLDRLWGRIVLARKPKHGPSHHQSRRESRLGHGVAFLPACVMRVSAGDLRHVHPKPGKQALQLRHALDLKAPTANPESQGGNNDRTRLRLRLEHVSTFIVLNSEELVGRVSAARPTIQSEAYPWRVYVGNAINVGWVEFSRPAIVQCVAGLEDSTHPPRFERFTVRLTRD